MDENQAPITLTDKAAEKLLEFRAAEAVAPEKGLRIAVHGGGCAGFTYELGFDEPKPDVDQTFQLKGITVIIDSMSLMYVRGSELDYVDGLNGGGFKLNNPNATSTCGCGSSFSA